MKKLIGCAWLAVVFLAAWSLPSSADKPASKNPNLGKLRHVVLFKFKDGTTLEQVKAIEEAFGKLPSKIPEVVDYEWGTNDSPEGLNEGLTHCFLVTFRDAEAGPRTCRTRSTRSSSPCCGRTWIRWSSWTSWSRTDEMNREGAKERKTAKTGEESAGSLLSRFRTFVLSRSRRRDICTHRFAHAVRKTP